MPILDWLVLGIYADISLVANFDCNHVINMAQNRKEPRQAIGPGTAAAERTSADSST